MPYSVEGSNPHFDYANNILQNVRGYTDHAELDKFERNQTFKSIIALERNPVQGNFD